MALSTTDSRFVYDGDASTTAFSYPRKVIEAAHLDVYLYDEDDDSYTLQTLNTHYTFAGSGLSNGIYASATITFLSAPGTDKKVVIYRDPTLTQEADFTAESNVLTLLNRFADRVEMKLQRMQDQLDRTIRLPDGDYATSWGNSHSKLDYASKVLGFSSTGVPEPLENDGASTSVTATGSTTARTLAARFGDMLSPEDFGAVGDGTTDDKTPLTNWLNAVMASSSRCGYMPAKTYAISGALPNINVSGVQIFGSGPSSSHDVGSNPTPGTTLKAITNSGFTMMTVAPTEGASAQRLDSVRILGVSFNCNSLAAKGLLVKSVFRGEFDVYAQEATTSGLELDVATTLGEAKDTQRNVFRFTGRQYSNTAPALRIKGSSTANTSFNQFEHVDVAHYNGTGVIVENADNNVWHDLRIIRAAGGSATNSIEWQGGSAVGTRARAEFIYQFSATVAAIVKGTASYTYPATDIVIDVLDIENGTPEPTVEAGATARWGKPATSDANDPSYNLIVNGDMLLNQLAPATNADKSAGFDGGVVLTQSNAVALTAVSAPESGQVQCLRMTQSNASAQRMGYLFVVPNEDTVRLRGQGVALSARIRQSTSADVRCAILEWTGTADAVAGDIVADWTSTTYTTAGFFESTTKNVLAVSETAVTADTWRDLSGPLTHKGGLTATVGASANNLLVLVWTEATVAQNVTLDIGRVRLLRGYMPNNDFRGEDRSALIARCERFVQKTYGLSVAPGTSTAVGMATFNASGNAQQSRWFWPFRTRMRATPTCTVYSQTGASGNVRDVTAGADLAASTTGPGEGGVTAYPTANTTSTNIIGFHVVATAYPWV